MLKNDFTFTIYNRIVRTMCLGILFFVAPVHAGIIDFTTGGGTTGDTLDGQSSGTFAVPELTGTTITISTTTANGKFNATSNDSGIDRSDVTGSGGDDADRFDTGEDFTFSFNQDATIILFDFSSIGAGDSLTLHAGSESYAITEANVSDSKFTPTGGSVTVASGGLITIMDVIGNFGFQTIELTVVPEPSTWGLFCLGGMLIGTARRRTV
jgi:hypothetical protein